MLFYLFIAPFCVAILLMVLVSVALYIFSSKMNEMFTKCVFNLNDKESETNTDIVLIEKVKYPLKPAPMSTFKDFKIIKGKSVTKNLSCDEFIQYIKRNDLLVIPYCMDGPNVVFTVMNRSVNINNNKMAFFYLTQIYYNESKLITINIHTLSHIMDKIDINNKNILFVHNMGRCGSNLLTKLMLEMSVNKNDLFIINETNIFPHILKLLMNSMHWKNEKLSKLLFKVCIKAMIFGLTQNNTNRKVIFKEASQLTWCMPLICDIFPNINHIYLYRDSYDQIDSFSCMFETFFDKGSVLNRIIPLKKIIYFMENIYLFNIAFGKFVFTQNTISLLTNCSYDSVEKELNGFRYLCQYFALHWISQMNVANKCINNSKLQFCIKYNDLKSNSYKMIKNIYDKLSWDCIENNETVLDKVLAKDSHQASGGIQSQRKGKRKFAFLKPYHLNEINYVIQNFKEYSEITSTYTLPKTILAD